MNFFLIGKGKVGTAFSNYFHTGNISFSHCETADISNECGVVFVAVNDSEISSVALNLRNNNKDLFIVHFSAAAHFEDKMTFLLHPYCSISGRTDLSKVIFTLWGDENNELEKLLKNIGLKFICAGQAPSPFYHISAVISGNFTQFFFMTAIEMLKKEGFSDTECKALVFQLIHSSLKNSAEMGIKGMTGPAVRGEMNIVDNETEQLRSIDPELSELFYKINQLIIKAVKQ